jgi:hypothetical protein
MSDPVATTRPVRFRRISELPLEPASEWSDVYLTFDIDWACDEVLAETIDLVESAGVAATWFVTHATPLLGRLMRNPAFELGVHPNFNPLLAGAADAAGIIAVMDDLRAIVPDARVVRAHSMVQSSRLSQVYVDRGFTHECNDFIPEQAEWDLRPWRLWNGLLRVPHFWEDDATCLYRQWTPMATLLSRPGLKVFNFHPIHVFLNTEDLDRYERTRPWHQRPGELRAHRHAGAGTRAALCDLLKVRG